MNRLKEVNKEIDKISKKREKKMKSFDFQASDSFDDWEEMLEPFAKKLQPLLFERQQLEPLEWEEKIGGDLFTMEDWIDCVKTGGFIDYDGSGTYSDGKRESNKYIHPSDVKGGFLLKNKEFTHIVWYNR